jgi:glycerate 2-kinase
VIPGFELFAKFSGLRRKLRNADLVLTGEGALDRSSLMGKGVGELGKLCQAAGVPCLAIGGKVEGCPALAARFSRVRALTSLTSARNAQARPAFWLASAVERLARDWPPGKAGTQICE